MRKLAGPFKLFSEADTWQREHPDEPRSQRVVNLADDQAAPGWYVVDVRAAQTETSPARPTTYRILRFSHADFARPVFEAPDLDSALQEIQRIDAEERLYPGERFEVVSVHLSYLARPRLEAQP